MNQQQDAIFAIDRGTAPIGAFNLITDVAARNRYVGFYFADVIAIGDQLHLTLSGRYNRAHIEIKDQSGLTPALNGDHNFQRFNPAIGMTFNPRVGMTYYASYQRGMRAPTPAELTCADPAAPCQLPNAFLSDPPLLPVLAETWELGFRAS